MFALYVLIFMLIVFLFSEEVMRNETLLLATNFAMPGPHIKAPRRFFFSMLVDLEQWRSAIGALGLSIPYKMCRKVIRGAGFVPSLSSLIELYLFCWLFVFISVPMLPVAVAVYILVAQFVHSEKFCFLHIYAYHYFHIRFLIHCCLGKMTKLPGLVRTFFLQHNHLIVQYANF